MLRTHFRLLVQTEKTEKREKKNPAFCYFAFRLCWRSLICSTWEKFIPRDLWAASPLMIQTRNISNVGWYRNQRSVFFFPLVCSLKKKKMQSDLSTLSAHGDGARRDVLQNKPCRIFMLELLVRVKTLIIQRPGERCVQGLSLITLCCLIISEFFMARNLSFLQECGLEF